MWYDARHNYTLQFDSSLNCLDLHSGHRVIGKLESLYNHSVVKWQKLEKVTQVFAMADCVREMTVKKSCNLVYGSFEHVLFFC